MLNETSPTSDHGANGSANAETIRKLEEECARLRDALANAERERNCYHELFLQQARAAREFADLDIPTLEAMSAGPVEMIE